MSVKQASLNGRTYYIGRLQHTASRDTFFLLLKNLGPALGELVAQLASGKKLSEIDIEPAALGRAIQDVCLRLSSQDAATISEAFGSVTTVVTKGAKVELTVKAQESHFAGALGEWFQWLGICCEWNYSDFLGLLTRGDTSPSVEIASQAASPGAA